VAERTEVGSRLERRLPLALLDEFSLEREDAKLRRRDPAEEKRDDMWPDETFRDPPNEEYLDARAKERGENFCFGNSSRYSYRAKEYGPESAERPEDGQRDQAHPRQFSEQFA